MKALHKVLPMILPIILLAGASLVLAACHGLTAEQIATLRDQGFKEGDNNWTFGTEDRVTFNSNTATVKPEVNTRLRNMGAALHKVAIDHMMVNGYTDRYGSESYNNELSLKRAQAVANELIAGGVPATGITVQGLGSRAPVTTGTSAQDLEQNRRVAIIVSSE